jgi:hypothetical protein
MVILADPLKKGSSNIVILTDSKRKVVVLLWF